MIFIPQAYRDLEEQFGVYLTYFSLGGLPVMNFKNKIYYIFVIVSYLNMSAITVGLVLDVYVYFDDLTHMMETARITIAFLVATWVWHVLFIQRKNLINLMRLATAFATEEVAVQSEGFPMTKLLPRIKILTRRAFSFVTIFHFIYCVIRLYVRDDRPFTLNTYYGEFAKESPYYELINIVQFLGTVTGFVPFFVFTGLYAHLVAVACSQLERLKASLLSIDQNSKSNKNPTYMKNTLEKELNLCIRHHQQIMEYMTALEDTVNPILVGHFFFILMGMCFSAFSFAENWGNTVDMSQSSLNYVCFLGKLYVYCWLGNELTNLAESVSEAAWESDWVGAPISFQRSLVVVIALANKEYVVTAGKFVPASRKTMMNVINQTISFLMFLMQVKDKDKDTA